MSPAVPTTIVTGAAGFAGLHLVERIGPSAIVHGWALPGTPRPAATVPIRWHDVDVADRTAVDRAIETIAPDRIFHLAGAPSVETSWTNAVPHLTINAMGTAHILDAVRHHQPSCRVLVVTSAQVYQTGDQPVDELAPLVPPSPYGLTKLAQDQLAEAAARVDAMDVVIARPFNHIGPRQAPGFAVPSFARQIARIERGLEPPVIRVGNLDTYRDFTDVRDVVDAYCRIMDGAPAGRAYNVCSGYAYRIGDLLDALIGLAQVLIGVTTDTARLRPADVPRIVGNSARLHAELGWAPRIPITTTLKDTLEWWREDTRRTHALHAGT
jgi:GDP-4-dehydro-6-deoxy-D-mannose reductase